MCLTGGQQRADDRHVDCRLMVAAEEVIFPSQSYRPDDIFSQIVIPKQASVLQASHHVAPSGIGIRDGFPGLGVGTVLDTFRFHPHLHGVEMRLHPNVNIGEDSFLNTLLKHLFDNPLKDSGQKSSKGFSERCSSGVSKKAFSPIFKTSG